MARCYSRDKQNDPLEKKSSKLESSDGDSDSDIDYVPHLVIKSGNDEEKMSCFSEDKLPSSFINEVVSISSNIIVLRSSIQNLGECNKWILEFGNLTNTKWNTRSSRPCGTRFICSKKYVCHRSKFMKVPAEKNSRSFSKNSGCLATISIKVKLKTYATKRKDLFIKRGLLALITISDLHNHSLNTADDLKYLPNPECKEKFFKYFSDGMSVPESHRYHKKNVQLNHESAEGGLANGCIIPSRRTVQYWHELWRLQKTGNIVIEEAGSSQNADDIEEENKIKSSGSDSDSDIDYKPLLDVMTGNIKENMSCFSEDKLPSSFINVVASISSNTIVVRSNIQNIEECNKWISEFSNLTNTKWNLRDSRPCGQRFTFWKKYVCHRSKFRKVPAEENKRGFSKNAGCVATINIKVKLKTSSTKWKDSFILKGLLAIITIKDVHNHSFNTEVDFKYRPKSDCKEKFLKYFSDGMGVAESLKYHIKTCHLSDTLTKGDSCINSRSRRRVHYWYDRWRVQNCSQNTGNSIIEGAGSSKDADDIDEGASTSKLPEIDVGSLNQNRPVLSLKCLHEDTDDESLSSKMEEDDLSSKFIDVNDVPELPLNDKDEHQVEDVLDPKSDSEEHPNLEPVVKKPPAIEPAVKKLPTILPAVKKPPAMEPVVTKPPATEPVVNKPTPMILIPVVNISAQTPVIPLRKGGRPRKRRIFNFSRRKDHSTRVESNVMPLNEGMQVINEQEDQVSPDCVSNTLISLIQGEQIIPNATVVLNEGEQSTSNAVIPFNQEEENTSNAEQIISGSAIGVQENSFNLARPVRASKLKCHQKISEVVQMYSKERSERISLQAFQRRARESSQERIQRASMRRAREMTGYRIQRDPTYPRQRRPRLRAREIREERRAECRRLADIIQQQRTNHEGVHNFRIKIDCSSAPKRSDCAVFSESRNKLYVCKDVPFIVYVTADNVPQGSMICVQAVFSRPEHAGQPVTRCPTHAQQDYTRGYPAYEHFVQCMNEGAIYEKNLKNSKMSVSVPYVEPQDGESFSSYLFKLTCFNSCVGGINRRPFSLVFTLERNKFFLGRQLIEAKVCACPSRDCKSEDDKQERRTQNDSQVVTQQNVVAKAAVNIQPRPAANSQPRPAVNSQPRPAGRSQSSGSEKPKYTITVQDRETFEFLQHMKVLYEMNVDPILPDT